jgi:anti-anti-sigma regulatory factor
VASNAQQNPISTVAMTATRGVLVVTMQPDLEQESFETMVAAVLERTVKNKIRAVVLDFSAVDVMNLVEFDCTRALLSAVRCLGAETAIVSLSAGVVLYLTEVQAKTEGINFYFGLDEAFQRLGE